MSALGLFFGSLLLSLDNFSPSRLDLFSLVALKGKERKIRGQLKQIFLTELRYTPAVAKLSKKRSRLGARRFLACFQLLFIKNRQ